MNHSFRSFSCHLIIVSIIVIVNIIVSISISMRPS